MDTGNFEYCCNDPLKIQYSILHNPKPISIVPELRESIDRLLWYVPGISSIQSYENDLIDDPLYSEAVFQIILDIMGINSRTDYKLNDKIGNSDSAYYNSEICVKCQKVIITKYKNETIMRAMLRHIRNAIAHGSFTIIDNLVLFVDTKANRETALIKIDISSLDKAIRQIEDYNGITQELVIRTIFKNLGYNILPQNSRNRFDMIIEKDGKEYVIDIKNYKSKKLVGYNNALIDSLIDQFSSAIESNYIPVVIIDQSHLSDKAKEKLKKEGIIVLDKKNIAELGNMEDSINIAQG